VCDTAYISACVFVCVYMCVCVRLCVCFVPVSKCVAVQCDTDSVWHCLRRKKGLRGFRGFGLKNCEDMD